MIIRTGDRLQVSGDVTMENVLALFNDGLKPQASSDMVVDFALLEKVDSSAVSLMLAWLREAQNSKVSLRFINVPENLLSLSKLYGLAELLPLSTTE